MWLPLLLLGVVLGPSVWAQEPIPPTPVDPHGEYERRLEAARRLSQEVEERQRRAQSEDLSRREGGQFVFLKREDDGAFTALSARSVGQYGESTCPMSPQTGAIDPNATFHVRMGQDGAVEIVPTQPERRGTFRFPTFGDLLRRSEGNPRWRLRPNLDGSFEVCRADGTASGPANCNRWVIATVENVDSTTFIRGEGDSHAVDPNDLRQGSLGTCTLWAAVHAVLATRGPEEIEALFSSPGQVTFPGQAPIPVGDQFLFYWRPQHPETRTPIGVQFGDSDAQGRQESWPLLLEKAYTIWRRNLTAADSGAHPGTVLSTVTDQNVRTHYFHPFQSKDRVFECLRQANADGQPMVCGSRGSVPEGNPLGISPSHAYAAAQVVGGATPYVVLIDPHGKTVELTRDQFFEYFSMASYTEGPKGVVQRQWERTTRRVGDLLDATRR